jgi:TatD DNase family protein
MFIDTHTHLQFESYDEDRELVIQRAIKNDIEAIITIGTDIKSSGDALDLAQKFVVVYASVGIHPNDCMNTSETDLDEIEKMAQRDKAIAIGEIGLDYYRLYTPKEKQQDVLRKQVRFARKLGLPIIIHNRDAHEDIYNVLKEEKAEEISGVFHSFSGDIKFLESILALNYHVSFTGPVTFKNTNYNKLIECVPLEQLLLETDSPFLAPVPFRGKRNEPSYIRYIAEKIAQVKGTTTDKLAEITSDNAKNLFHLSDQWQLKLNL